MEAIGSRPRIRLILFSLLSFALIIAVRLYYLQIVHGDEYADRADRQYVMKAENIFDRGGIFFQDKNNNLLGAATLASGYTIAINPREIIDPMLTYEKISGLINLDLNLFLAKTDLNSYYQKLADRVPESMMQKISDLKLPGILIEKDRWRYYPGGSSAARTLGFVAYDENHLVGRYGLEKYYEDILSRTNDSARINFFAEIFSNLKVTLSGDSRTAGEVVTTLEPTVEGFLEKTLGQISSQYQSKITGGIIIDPETGEIYAMAIKPDFDLNKFNLEKDPSVFNNPLVEGIYEMGSIIKPLTMAAGLDSGIVTAESKYEDTGSLTLNNYTIYNHDKKTHGLVDMQEVLNKSLNLGVSYVARKMGAEKFTNYFYAFGLDEETGIDLPGENHGRLNNLENPKDIELATASFGQGIALTPIGTVRALSVLANGGKLITPHLVKRINYKTGLFNNISYVNEAKQVIKKETAEEISRMLTRVVDEALLNGAVKMDHYSIAAKTGTAQIAKPEGGYFDDRWLHSFFGYFPSYEPRFLIFLYTLEPQGVSFASQTLTEPFMQITKFLISYYNIAPDR